MKTRFRFTVSQDQLNVLQEQTGLKLASDAFLAIILEQDGEEPSLVLVPECDWDRVQPILQSRAKKLMPLGNDPN